MRDGMKKGPTVKSDRFSIFYFRSEVWRPNHLYITL